MKTLTNIIISIAAALSFCAFLLYTLDASCARRQAYESANNCRYESGFCYTYQERGYLFDECKFDKACREQWGL